jgi:hypothetical protein
MARSLYNQIPTYAEVAKRTNRLLAILIALNIGLATAALTMWTMLRLFVSEPVNWATLRRVGASPELLEYPFILLWLVPMCAASLAWLSARMKMTRLARIVALVPILVFMIIHGWFYLTPMEWH